MGLACSSLTAPPTSTCAKCKNKIKHLDEKVCMCCSKPYHNSCIYVLSEIPSNIKNTIAGFYKSTVYKIKSATNDPKDKFCCSVCYHKKYLTLYFQWFEKYEYFIAKQSKKAKRLSGSTKDKHTEIPAIEQNSVALKRLHSQSSGHSLSPPNESDFILPENQLRIEITPPPCEAVPPPCEAVPPPCEAVPPSTGNTQLPASELDLPLIQQQRNQLKKLVTVLYNQDLVNQEIQASTIHSKLN
jgi:hypothetical protein